MRLRSTAEDNAASAASYEELGMGDPQRIGEMLVNTGVITPEQLGKIVTEQAATGALFGETALRMGLIDQKDLDRVIAQQQSYTLLDVGDERLDPAVVAATNPHDVLSRAARDLRGMIHASLRTDGSRLRSVALVSMGIPAETAILAANLGVSAAQAGYRTLLIDADLTTPMVQGLFRVPNRAGLFTLLSRGGHFAEIAQSTVIPRLTVLTSGPDVPNAPELLEREKLFVRLRTAFDAYDLVIANMGDMPASAIHNLDGVDGVILNARRNLSPLRGLRDMSDRMAAADIAVLGVSLVA
jgi:receptor protein-tyrosine kinase